MSEFKDAFRNGGPSHRGDSRRYTVAGRPLQCPHCGGERFRGREVPLGSRTAVLFEAAWMSDGAYAMTCAECSRIEWFAERPERSDP